jgi:putative ABC transport system permease protein
MSKAPGGSTGGRGARGPGMRFGDVFLMSLGAIGSNKLRSFLALVGIVLGVASIIGVMTAISVMQATMEKEMTVLGTQTFQVQKWGNFNSEEEFRAAQKWPPVTLEEAQAIRDQVSSVDLVGTSSRKAATCRAWTCSPRAASR